jgi:nucleoside-diphosphate-sugar epimerase
MTRADSPVLAGTPHVMVTGAVGFIGLELCRVLATQARVTAVIRRPSDRERLPAGVGSLEFGDITKTVISPAHFEGVDVVVHLAARVHVLHDQAQDPLAAFRATNVVATMKLARAAADAGVPHFVFMSTVGVNGGNSGERSFQESDRPNPHTPYARSKLEAELALQDLSAQNPMIATTFRPPLVYGPAVPGNFGRLIAAVDRGIPLPLGAVQNQRSLVFVGNLVNAVVKVIHSRPETSEVFFVADADAVSTPALVRKIAHYVDRPARLLPVPVTLLRLAGRIAGRSREVDQLVNSLKISTEKLERLHGWQPPWSLDTGLALSLQPQRHDAQATGARISA